MIDLLSIGLATYYITFVVVYKDGPFDLIAKLRFFMGVNAPVLDMDARVIGFECNGSFLSKLISCYTCTSLWVGITVGLVYFLVSPESVLLIGAIGLSNYLLDVSYGN